MLSMAAGQARQTPPTLFEKVARRIRRIPVVSHSDAVWNLLRPLYDGVADRMYPNGIAWTINGEERMVLSPRMRAIPEVLEPCAWKRLMEETRPQDVVADIGSNVGMFAVAFARRVGSEGRVYAFEPDPGNHEYLLRHIALNHVSDRVVPVRCALGTVDGTLPFVTGLGAFSHVDLSRTARPIPCARFDTFFATRRVSIVKLDVVGFEEEVLRGAQSILAQAGRRPRLFHVELLPPGEDRAGLTNDAATVRSFLQSFGYRIEMVEKPPAVLAYTV